MIIEEFIRKIEEIAPKKYAESWDNVGLQLGSAEQEVKKILLTLDVDDKICSEAIAQKVDLIISHHPLIFEPLQSLAENSVKNKIITRLIKNGIALYAVHTNFDHAILGMNAALAEKMGLEKYEVLQKIDQKKLYKLVVFVPIEYADKLRKEMCAAGGGSLGDYDCCTFTVDGKGTYRPLPGASPFLGEVGSLTTADECKVELIVESSVLAKVIEVMKKHHPYEEVAYDVYENNICDKRIGAGFLVNLSAPLTVQSLALQVKNELDCEMVKVTGDLKQEVQKIAFCGGSGSFLLEEAQSRGASCLVTGDLKYHEARKAQAQGMVVIDAGHFETERIFSEYLKELLQKHMDSSSVEILVAGSEEVPWSFL